MLVPEASACEAEHNQPKQGCDLDKDISQDTFVPSFINKALQTSLVQMPKLVLAELKTVIEQKKKKELKISEGINISDRLIQNHQHNAYLSKRKAYVALEYQREQIITKYKLKEIKTEIKLKEQQEKKQLAEHLEQEKKKRG